MNSIKKGIKLILNLAMGYVIIPVVFVGGLLATNSSKGWGINNPDGELFIPVGIIMLIFSAIVIILKIKYIIHQYKNQLEFGFFRKYIEVIFWGFGFIIFIIEYFIRYFI